MTSVINGRKGVRCSKKLNQFGDFEDTTNMSVDDWNKRWDKDQTQFHMPKVHPVLQKHIQRLTDGKPHLRIFVPLSGKSLDLKWLLDQGHEVVGCDCSERGCQEVFDRDGIPFSSEYRHTVKSNLYKATDGRKLTMYAGDFYDLHRKELGEFDCVWDRGSFVAVPVTRRKEYSDILVSTMTNETKYMLDCFLVDNEIFGGPPFDCCENDVRKYFGKQCVVEKFEERDAFTKWQASWGLKTFVEEVYMLTLKSNQIQS